MSASLETSLVVRWTRHRSMGAPWLSSSWGFRVSAIPSPGLAERVGAARGAIRGLRDVAGRAMAAAEALGGGGNSTSSGRTRDDADRARPARRTPLTVGDYKPLSYGCMARTGIDLGGTVFDFGCGRGEVVRVLAARSASTWVHCGGSDSDTAPWTAVLASRGAPHLVSKAASEPAVRDRRARPESFGAGRQLGQRGVFCPRWERVIT
jgi:hypothetical protein